MKQGMNLSQQKARGKKVPSIVLTGLLHVNALIFKATRWGSIFNLVFLSVL